MQCPICGKPTPDGSAFCPTCGSKLNLEQTVASSPEAATLPPSRPDDTRLEEAATVPAPPSGKLGATPGAMMPGTPFGRRYRILKQLGQGGMGVVYQAWDEELGVAVALKLIRPEASTDPASAADLERRFKRELLTARQVTHKHVVRIHDLGELDGVRYITMPYIEGRHLGALIAAEGKLPVARALKIVRQIAEGLAAAHESGVIHRDLKPENVMLDTDDSAIIMDFGLARSGTGADLTAAGTVMGTVSYMAPEQARGETLDARADLYALGLVCYDMLAGRVRLGQHRDAMSELVSRMQAPPPALPQVEPRVPTGLAAVVMRAVSPKRDDRQSSVRAFLDELNRLDNEGHAPVETTPTVSAPTPVPVPAPPAKSRLVPIAAAAVVALGLAGWLFTRGSNAPAATDTANIPPKSVLIGDFKNDTGDAAFDGTLEPVLTLGVEGASFITAYPRRDAERAAQQIKQGSKLDEEVTRLVCQREGVSTGLIGTIRAEGGGYVLTVRVVDPVPGTELARVNERASSKEQVLAAVAALAAKVRQALGDTTPTSAMAASAETFTASSLEAARDYAQAQSLANANKDEEAIVLYQRALEQDPRMGRALSGWAASLVKLGRRQEAEAQYQKALALVDRMTEREKFRTLGTYYLNIAGNYDTAIENYTALLAKYPSDGAGHNNLALAYFNTLQFAKALEQGRKLLGIYPKSALYRTNQALYAMYAGDFSTAASEGRRGLEINPNSPKAHLAIAMAALAGGKIDEARVAYENARTSGGVRGTSLAVAGLADMLLHEGKLDEGASLLEDGLAADETENNRAAAAAKAIALAEARWALGQTSPALAALERATKLAPSDAAVQVVAARVSLDAGRSADATRIADRLDTSLSARAKAYGRLVRAMGHLSRGRTGIAPALTELAEAQKLADLWLVRFYKGVAYVERGAFPEALAELELAERRRGEATAVFLDDVPTYRYLVPLTYWLGRAQEGLGAKDAAVKSYNDFLRLKGTSPGALLEDAGARMKKLAN